MRKYGKIRQVYPVHYECFRNLQARSSSCGGTDFTDDASGLLLFIEEIGLVPDGMIRPTVGRKDHNKGYVIGNFAWQEYSDNLKEALARTNTHRRKVLLGRTLSDNHRRNLSIAKMGNRILAKLPVDRRSAIARNAGLARAAKARIGKEINL